MRKLIFLLIAVVVMTSAEAGNQENPSMAVEPQNAHHLQELNVVASRITQNTDGYTINLRGSAITKGKAATDVLPFLPGISKENGNFKINGLPVSEVFVDGVKLSDRSELANIPGETIEKVEVKYLAGSDQSASLSGGNVYITLRRPRDGGYYGNVNADAEWRRASGFGNEGAGGMINYRYRRLSVYDNLYLAGSKVKENAEERQTGPDLHNLFTEQAESKGFNFRNRLSLNLQLQSGVQLGVSYLLADSRVRLSTGSRQVDEYTVIKKRDNTLLQEGTIRFIMPLRRKGSSMEITADYLNRSSDRHSDYFIVSDEAGKEKKDVDLNLWKIKADFIYPCSKRLAWKFGVSSQWISSSLTPKSVIGSDRFELSDISTRTTGFTPIIYASAQGVAWKVRYSAGVNWQMNKISYLNRDVAVKNKNTQWALNPTLQLMMPFGAKRDHALMLNYKHTLNQIPYSAISSVINWRNPNNYTVGNPDLKAMSADMVMAALALFRNRLNISLLYAHSHNRIYWQTFNDPDNPDLFYTKPINIDGQGSWGMGVEWIESPAKWWRFKLSGRVEITPENTTIDNIYYGKTRCKEYMDFNNNFSFTESFGSMLNLNVEPAYKIFDRTYHSVYNLTGRIYKNWLEDRLQVAVDFTPIGNGRKIDRRIGEKRISYRYTSPVQHVGLSLTWRFSGGKKVKVNVVEGIQEHIETTDNL